MLIEDHIAAVDVHGRALGAAAKAAGRSAAIPNCPDWTVDDLLRHIGLVHRWAGTIVGDRLAGPPDLDAEILATAPDSDALFDWFEEGHARLIATLTSAPRDLDFWHFIRNDSPLGSWARRQAHETTIHGLDAANAAGQTATFITGISPELAADGIDELLTGFLPRRSSRLRSQTPTAVAIHAVDSGHSWRVSISAEPPAVTREDESPVDTTICGDAVTVYQALWNRLPLDALQVTGSSELVEVWRDQVKVTWS